MKKKTSKYWKNQLDPLMSKLVRDKRVCERCGKRGDVGDFDDAHIIGRINLALRWDIFNHLCLCYRCHRFFWHEEPLQATKWFQEKYPARYDYLMANKDKIIKRTDEDYLKIKEAILNKDVRQLATCNPL